MSLLQFDRREKIQVVVDQMEKLFTDAEICAAWRALTVALQEMAAPDSRPPRFNMLLDAILDAAEQS